MMDVMTIQEAVNKLTDYKITWRVGLKLLWIFSFRMSGPLTYSVTNFAGYQPYTSWRCLKNSTRCLDRVVQTGISRESFCGTDDEGVLVENVDIEWDLNGRSTYAIGWNLLCDREYVGTFISSAYFVGAFLGIAISSFLFDRFGRLFVLKISEVCTLILCICMIFANKIEYMISVRIFLGAAFFISNNGLLLYSVESGPYHLRIASNVMCSFFWFSGEFLIAVCGYLSKNWVYILVFTAVVMCFNFVALFIYLPESPMFLLSNKKDEAAAKESLNKLYLFYNGDETTKFTDIKLCEHKEDSIARGKQSLKDFYKYPTMTKNLIILMYAWMTTCGLYYGFAFSWAKLGKNLYISYVLSGTVGLLSLLLLWPYYKGKRRRVAIFHFAVSACLILAIIPSSVGTDVITVSQVACLLGALLNDSVFTVLNLWTQEVSPTTHRGKIIAISSSSGRIFSLLGPQASLLFEWNKTATLIGFSVIALGSGLLMLLLPETSKRPMPSQANEVTNRIQQIKSKIKNTESNEEV